MKTKRSHSNLAFQFATDWATHPRNQIREKILKYPNPPWGIIFPIAKGIGERENWIKNSILNPTPLCTSYVHLSNHVLERHMDSKLLHEREGDWMPPMCPQPRHCFALAVVVLLQSSCQDFLCNDPRLWEPIECPDKSCSRHTRQVLRCRAGDNVQWRLPECQRLLIACTHTLSWACIGRSSWCALWRILP